MMRAYRTLVHPTSFLFAFIFLASTVAAQTGTVKGTVKNSNGDALPGASVQVQGSKAGTVADSDGNYSISLAPGKHVIIISFAGYATERTEVNVTEGSSTDLSKILI